MSATFINNNNGGLTQITGIIRDTEVNNLGTTPYVFNLPANFAPFNFAYKVISGVTQPNFTSDCIITCITTLRNIFGVKSIFTTNYALSSYINTGLITGGPVLNVCLCYDQEFIPNNYIITSLDGLDPTPGDMSIQYVFTGFYLF